MINNNLLRRGIAVAAALSTVLPVASIAQTTAPRRGNVLQRHPTATGVAAGAVTHQALKASARNKKARGKKLNFAERHPTITGIGAAIGARHLAKRYRK